MTGLDERALIGVKFGPALSVSTSIKAAPGAGMS
jgi:hypothetical protein